MLRNTPSSYGSVAKLLHWSIVVLIITQLVLGISADDLPNGLRKLELLAWHKSFGMLILMLALVRLAWRYANPRPAPPPVMPPWQAPRAAAPPPRGDPRPPAGGGPRTCGDGRGSPRSARTACSMR